MSQPSNNMKSVYWRRLLHYHRHERQHKIITT